MMLEGYRKPYWVTEGSEKSACASAPPKRLWVPVFGILKLFSGNCHRGFTSASHGFNIACLFL